jgi:DNA-binding NarL/FixJ family response regulator
VRSETPRRSPIRRVDSPGAPSAATSGSRRVSAPPPRCEQEVAALVAQGLTNRRIGERLVISERTVENHVQHILSRLGFERRAQIAAWAAERPSAAA